MSDETMTKAPGEEPTSAAPSEEPKKRARKQAEAAEAPIGQDASDDSMMDEKDEPREQKIRRRGRTKVSYLTLNKIETVDYKDVAVLKRFLTERGKILPRRQTGNTAKQQRMISTAIKRAREMALLPFVAGGPGSDDGLGRRTRRPE